MGFPNQTLSQRMKLRMKKFIKFWNFLVEKGIFTKLAFIITMGWLVYAVNIIKIHGSILGNIFFFVWAMVLTFIWLCYKSSEK
jgi:hypothetical protein